MANSAGAHYLDAALPVRQKALTSRTGVWLAALVGLLAVVGSLVLGAIVAFSALNDHKPVATTADAFVCGTMGTNLDSRTNWAANGAVALPDVTKRTFALPEVVGGSVNWSTFKGTLSDEPDFAVTGWNTKVDDVNSDGRAEVRKLPKTEDLPEELQEWRSFAHCLFAPIPSFLGSGGLHIANFISNISAFVATTAFNSSFICPPDKPEGAICIDLLTVLAGDGSNDRNQGGTGEGSNSGIIGSLTSGLYKPLILIVVLVGAISVGITGIVKRKYREAIFQFIWLAVMAVVGLVLLLNPSMLVKAPLVGGNAIVGCVVGAFNGSGCGSGGSSPASSGDTSAKANVCNVWVDGVHQNGRSVTVDEKAGLHVSSMACSIWSAFVLEPFAQGQYGVGVDTLDLGTSADNSPVVEASADNLTMWELMSSKGWNRNNWNNNYLAGADQAGNPYNICVNLKARNGQSFNSMGSEFNGKLASNPGGGSFGSIPSGAGTVCNLAVWDLFMKTNASGGFVLYSDVNPDPQWLQVISRLPEAPSMFTTFVGDNGGWNRFGMGFLAFAASAASSIMIIATSVLALVHYVIAVVMMAFAPVFLLFGMHPGRGKRIMLGWLEQVVSNIMKYIISAVFLLIAISVYGAILGSSTGLFSSLLFVVIMTMALLMYRKELISILSRVEMGGEKMTNMAERFMDRSKQVGSAAWKPTRAVAAGTIAAGVTGSTLKTGLKTSVMRELRQNSGLIGRATQAADSISTDTKNDMYRATRAKQEDARAAESLAVDAENAAMVSADNLGVSETELSNARVETGRLRAEADDASEDVTIFNSVEESIENNLRVKVDGLSDAAKDTRKLESEQMQLRQFQDDASNAKKEMELLRASGDIAGANEKKEELHVAMAAIHESEERVKKMSIDLNTHYTGAELSQAKRELFMAREEARNEVYASTDFESDTIARHKELVDEGATQASLEHRADVANVLADDALETQKQKVREYLNARRDLEEKLEEATQRKTDHNALSAEAVKLNREYQDFTPGELVSNRRADRIRANASGIVAVDAVNETKFSDSLQNKLDRINLEEDHFQNLVAPNKGERVNLEDLDVRSDDLREFKLGVDLDNRGTASREAENATASAILDRTRGEKRKSLQDERDKLRKYENMAQELEISLEDAKAQDEGRFVRRTEIGADGQEVRSSLKPSQLAAERNVAAARTREEQATNLRDETKELHEKNSVSLVAARTSLENNPNDARSQELLNSAERAFAKSQEKLNRAESEVFEAKTAHSDALREFQNQRTAPKTEVVQERLAEVNEKRTVSRVISGYEGSETNPGAREKLTALREKGLSVESIELLDNIQSRMKGLVDGAEKGVISDRNLARLIQAQEQINRTNEPDETMLRAIDKLLPQFKSKNEVNTDSKANRANQSQQPAPSGVGERVRRLPNSEPTVKPERQREVGPQLPAASGVNESARKLPKNPFGANGQQNPVNEDPDSDTNDDRPLPEI